MRSNWIAIATVSLALVAATVATYFSATTCGFVNFDDPEYVYQNRHVLAGLSWSGFMYAWTSFDCSNWHPLTWLSLELDASVWGQNPAGYHATNLVLHIANGVLIFLVLNRMTKNLWRSACVAAFFGLHPLHVESVAWVSERKDVLSTLFLLLTIAAYIHYSSRPSVMRYLSVLVMMTLGLLAKPMLVTLPILLVLLDCWPLDRVRWSHGAADTGRFPCQSIPFIIIEKLPLLLLAFIDGVMTVFAQRNATKALLELTITTRIANMFHAFDWYILKTFFPTNLSVFYPHPEQNLPWSFVGIGILLVTGISAWVLYCRRSKPHLVVGWLWFFIALMPVIGLLQVGGQAYADRYSYVPHFGLFVMVVWEIHSWFASTRNGRIFLSVVTVLAIVACGLLTRSQIQYWQNSDTLWTRATEINPENGVAHAHLADVRLAEGDHERAILHIRQATQQGRFGFAANAYCNWGRSLIALDRPAEAEQKFLEALKVDGYHEVSLDELLKLLRKQGRNAEATQVSARYRAALMRQAMKNPEDSTTQLNLGLALARQGNIKQAIQHFEKAVQLSPQSAAAYNNLALAQVQLKLYQESKINFLRALELNPELAMAHFNLAAVLESENDTAGAKKHFAEAFRIDPNDAEAKRCLDRLSNL